MRFVCNFLNRRDGFNHECSLINDEGTVIGYANIHYINRTWEMHPFDTAKSAAISNAIERRVAKAVSEWRTNHPNANRLPNGFRKMVASQQTDLNELRKTIGMMY